MQNKEKILGEDRRTFLANTLKNATRPMTGRELGELTNVSRQVIVGDITLLKAKKEPIIATNQGYIYIHDTADSKQVEKTIVVNHLPEETEEELNILVDHGVTVKDVRIEHPVYGDFSASIMVSNRKEVKDFLQQINEANAIYLSKLAEGGIHLHTISADRLEQIELAEEALKKAGFLVE